MRFHRLHQQQRSSQLRSLGAHREESYDYVEGFSKQVSRAPAQLNLSDLPNGYGFQFEVKLKDTTANESKPILDKLRMTFEPVRGG